MQKDHEIVAIAEPTAPVISLGTLTAATPNELITGASTIATCLRDMIRSQKLTTSLRGKEYVMVEGWTTLAALLGVLAREVETVERDGIYTATVELVRMSDGTVLTRASAECGDEEMWRERPKFARRSMAQTRATGKACRLAFSWIMKMAGYEATPAEEMQDIGSARVSQEPDKSLAAYMELSKPRRKGANPAPFRRPPPPAVDKEITTNMTPLPVPVTPGKLAELLETEAIPVARVCAWMAARYPSLYQDVTDIATLSQEHIDLIVARIPWFKRVLGAEANKDIEDKKAMEAALDMACSEYGWTGDAGALQEIIQKIDERAKYAHMKAQAKDGPMDRNEVKDAERLNALAYQLRKHLATLSASVEIQKL